MTSFKLTISDTKGKSLTKELKDAEAAPLLGLEIGKETAMQPSLDLEARSR